MTDQPLTQDTIDALLQQAQIARSEAPLPEGGDAIEAAEASAAVPDARSAPEEAAGGEPAEPTGMGLPLASTTGKVSETQAAAAGVRPALFSPLRPTHGAPGPSSIDLLLDVPLQVTVELGRTHLSVREVLALGSGSVVELEKLAGEPIDLLVNSRLIARGEVVVIDESFGVRVTEIVRGSEGVAAHR